MQRFKLSWMGPCHQTMASPQLADGGTASGYGGKLRIYWIRCLWQPTRDVPPAWRLEEVQTNPHCKTQYFTKHFTTPRTWIYPLVQHKHLRPLGRPRHRWEYNIKMDLQDVGWGGMDSVALAQDRDTCRALGKVVINCRVA